MLGFWWEVRKERDHMDDLSVGEEVLLKWILEKKEGMI
jgi:hypothetical protein